MNLPGHLPAQFDPHQLVKSAFNGEGKLPVSQCKRVLPHLTRPDGEIAVSLKAGKDEQGIAFLEGKIQVSVFCTCQRCLSEMELNMKLDFKLGIVNSEAEIDELPSDYEPLLANEMVFLKDIVEDEILLGFPLVPMHDDNLCGMQKYMKPEKTEEQSEEKKNPFAVLETLRKQ